ncbi:MAG: XdhC family protein [Deltaproteobacteria bacterium]|nr:XdhC family protein [Deltaproteobacteria bacterium]
MARTAGPAEVLRTVARALESGQSAVLATVLRRRGSTPATPGQKLALVGASELVGTVGGGALEQDVIEQLRAAAADPRSEPVVHGIDLRQAYGMACGGTVELLVEPLLPARPVLVVGAGHVGCAVAPLLAETGFRVVLCDTRAPCVAAARRHESAQLTVLEGGPPEPSILEAVGSRLGDAAVLVMTHDHALDEEMVGWALERDFGFVGGVGSRNKAARLRAAFARRGLAAERVAELRMPLGVDIGARSPAEIAVAIAGQLVAWRAASDRGGEVPASSPPEPDRGQSDTSE